MKLTLVIACLVVGCTTPDLKITYHVAEGISGPSCGSSSCADVPMACEAVLHLRVFRPSDPTAPFISICQDVRPNSTLDLCAIGQVDLPATQLPREILEVQVTVWPRDKVFDVETGELDCGRVSGVEFDANMGFPVPVAGSELQNPAFGGRAFYQPGDEETVVTLGCVDPASINDSSCGGGNSIQIKSTIGDFENLPFSVTPNVGDRLSVAIGEPVPAAFGSHQLFGTANLHTLSRTVEGPTPVWSGGIDDVFSSTACIQVFEDTGQGTSSLRCHNVSSFDTALDLQGIRLPKATLDQVLAALTFPSFPVDGLTIGIVLDNVGNPAPNKTVAVTAGTVEYLNATRSGLVTGQTSSSGMFVSRDAPYGTIFSTTQVNQTIEERGGLVEGKVTVVILQFDMPVGS
jgi:hypothetical protein